ncbi:hypothetical protein C8R32_104186 [Nitrosospira sp. Nsp5]|uniref:Uncharacterized protein n=1 Tax=Nitrosospira multiformis TaxID=1231 RepID=A0ABY0TEJ5_9PROT|nr:hypothetical protein C8R32_104186 [Nitrosospira sp. Nsp5]SDQ71013.1 hypothetical protein SAMN05216402_1964 [Nitrosospira multiformis]
MLLYLIGCEAQPIIVGLFAPSGLSVGVKADTVLKGDRHWYFTN